MNVYSIGVKKDIINILVQNGYDFLEIAGENELRFKYNLIKNQMDLYIHELDENHYQASIEQIKSLDLENVYCIVMIHKYSSQVIDDALTMKVDDIVVLPIERDILQKKIRTRMVKHEVTSMPLMPAEPPQDVEALVDDARIEDEMNRAIRGKYPLSFVMIEYDHMGSEVYKVFKKELRKLLRATDMILRYDANKLLILCPFTPKSHLVEVESKVREAHTKLSTVTVTPSVIFLYGVTFPDDGEEQKSLLEHMSNGLHDSMVFSSLGGTLHEMDKKALKTRLKKDYGRE